MRAAEDRVNSRVRLHRRGVKCLKGTESGKRVTSERAVHNHWRDILGVSEQLLRVEDVCEIEFRLQGKGYVAR
jgi:hypothetical protein